MASKCFYRVQKLDFSEEKCCQIYPSIKFLEQNFESYLRLGSCMENRAKSIFYSVLFNKFHPRIILMAFLVTIIGSRNQKKYSKF
jgi:hypothetical protein